MPGTCIVISREGTAWAVKHPGQAQDDIVARSLAKAINCVRQIDPRAAVLLRHEKPEAGPVEKRLSD